MMIERHKEFQEEAFEDLDKLSSEDLERYSSCYPKDLKHYLDCQKVWLEDSIYFLGTRLGKKPDRSEIAEMILSNAEPKRFRAYYALSYPSRVINSPK